jgi:hypothetical protein
MLARFLAALDLVFPSHSRRSPALSPSKVDLLLQLQNLWMISLTLIKYWLQNANAAILQPFARHISFEYLNQDYYGRDKVVGFGKFCHIFLGFYFYQP